MTDERGLTYPYIGPTRTQAKEIVWDDHVKAIIDICKQQGMIEGDHFKINNSDLSVRFKDRGKYVVDGADNIDSLRGKSDWGGVVMDEFASWKNKRYAWEEVIEPNLSVHEAWAIISGTPKGYEYFHRLVKMGDHRGIIEGEAYDEDKQIVKAHRDFLSFRFTSYDNPFLSRRFLDSKKERLTESAFNQEYMGRFEKYTGLIYKDFDRNVHVIEPFVPPPSWQHYRGMDFGAVNATVCLWVAIDPQGNFYIYDEYYNSGQRTEFHAGVILNKTRPNIQVIITWRDPSGEQAGLDYAGFGLVTTPAPKIYNPDKDWVLSGIDKVSQLLKVNSLSKKPRLFITRNCVKTINEFESYHWLETKTGEKIKDQPDKVDDHCMDTVRYIVEGCSPASSSSNDDYPNIPTNEFTGY